METFDDIPIEQEEQNIDQVVNKKMLQSIHNIFARLSSPVAMWMFFTVCNFLNYVDRGAFAGSLTAIGDDFDLSQTQRGLLGASFMLGYMIMAPLFGHLSRFIRPLTLMCVGLLIWSLASILTGASIGFWSLMMARAISGIGEASFAGLAPTYIDDIAPPQRKSVWLAVFFSMIPIGAAAGYGFAGVFSQFIHWRVTFIVEALLMIPYAICCYFVPDSEEVARKAGRVIKQPEHSPTEMTFLRSLQVLFGNIRYDVIVLGYAAVVFVAGALYFWAPEYVTKELGTTVVKADIGIGCLTVICGLVGTAFGGWLVDRLGGSDLVSASVCFLFSALSFPLAFVGFLVSNVYLFFILVAIGELLIFAITSPINTLCLSVVEPENRSFSITMQIFVIHLLGDFPSPFLIGAIADHSSLRVGMVFGSLWMLFAIFFFGLSLIVISSHTKRAYVIQPVELDTKGGMEL